jgi:hypothetical protein
MGLRAYADDEGQEWRVWRVVPDSISFATLVTSYRDGWLCFERVDGGERRRLAMTEVSPAWESFSDAQLDALRRQAEPVTRRTVAAAHVKSGTRKEISAAENDARSAASRRPSGREDARD